MTQWHKDLAMLTLNYATSLAQQKHAFSALLEQATQQQALSVVGLHASLVMEQFDSAHRQVTIKLINSLLRENIMQLQGNLLILPSNTLERKTWRIEELKCLSSGEIISMQQVVSAKQAQPISCLELISPLAKLFDSKKLTEFGRDILIL